MSDTPKAPKRGDTVFVRNGPGEWIGGIVNAVQPNGEMLVGVRGHWKGADAVLVSLNSYLNNWCYPGDVGQKSLKAEEITLDGRSQ